MGACPPARQRGSFSTWSGVRSRTATSSDSPSRTSKPSLDRCGSNRAAVAPIAAAEGARRRRTSGGRGCRARKRSCTASPSRISPNRTSPTQGRTVAHLSEQHRYLTERRARLEAKMETTRARLEATDSLVARRRHRQERSWLQNDLTIGARDIADVDRQLPQLETRMDRIRGDQVAKAAWRHRRAEVARRWRDLHDEACARIDRRVQAAEAAPSIAVHAAPPASFSAQWEWWSSAVEIERRRLWEGAQPSAGWSTCAAETARPTSRRPLAVRPDAADIIGRVDAAEAAAERRREEQRQRVRHTSFDPAYLYPFRQHEPSTRR